jgi:TldD protein
MNTVFDIAYSRLLAPAGLDDTALDLAFSRLLSPGIDFADLYFQHSRHESWALDDGIVKEGSHSIEQGVGVRAISGEKTGFAYSDDIRLESLLEAASAARAIARAGQQASTAARLVVAGRDLYVPGDPIDSLDNDAKVRLLREVDAFVRSCDPRVIQVSVSLAGVLDTVLIARSDGVLAGDVRPLVRCNVQVIVEQQGPSRTGLRRRWRTLRLPGTVTKRTRI